MLCSPGGAPIEPHEVDAFVERFRIRSHRDALDFVDRLFPTGHPLRQAYAWGVRQQFNRPHLVRLLERFHELEFLAPDELRGLSMPAHLVWGLDDYVLPSSHLDFYRTHLPPGSAIETPPTYGHAPFLHHADELAESLLGFIRRVR
jgi:pimeloyl-ACP methyl ester carboxylesterase